MSLLLLFGGVISATATPASVALTITADAAAGGITAATAPNQLVVAAPNPSGSAGGTPGSVVIMLVAPDAVAAEIVPFVKRGGVLASVRSRGSIATVRSRGGVVIRVRTGGQS